MADSIFERKNDRELQRLRQRQASSVVKINPNLKGFTSRFNPDIGRDNLLKLQRSKIPTEAELKQSVGVKTAKKLKKRRGKNLRGEVARNLREQRRFERGERRYKDSEEPRIVGDPAPPAGFAQAAAAAAAAEDPATAQLRLAIEGRRIAAQDNQQRRLVEALGERDDARLAERRDDRGERLAIEDRAYNERDALRAEAQLNQDRAIRERDDVRREGVLEREAISGRAVGEQDQLRREIRFNLGKAEDERGRVRDAADRLSQESAALRRAEVREERAERDALADRGAQERERLGAEERAERIQREQQVSARDSEREAEDRAERRAQREGDATERRAQATESYEERQGLMHGLFSERDLPDPIPEGLSQADREFLQRGLDRSLDQVDRRIGESEARIQEQMSRHAERVGRPAEDRPINISIVNPDRPALPPVMIPQPAQPSPAQPSPAQSPRAQSPEPREPPIQVRGDQPEGQIRVPGGDIDPFARDPEQDDFDQSGGGFSPEQDPVFTQPPREVIAEEPEPDDPADLATDFDRPFGPIRGDEEFVESEEEEQAEQSEEEEVGQFASLAQNAIGFVGDVAGGAAGGLAGLFQQEEAGGQQGGLLVDPSIAPPRSGGPRNPISDEEAGRFLGSGEAGRFEGDRPRPTIQPLGSDEAERRVPLRQPVRASETNEERLRLARSELDALKRRNRGAGAGSRGQTQSRRQVGSLAGSRFAANVGGVDPRDITRLEERISNLQGLVDVERQQAQQAQRQPPREEEPLLREVAPATPSRIRTDSQLFDSIEGEIDAYYTRGRAQGGARGSIPFMITNTTDRKYKGLEPGESVSLDQIEKDGKLGYYGRGKEGITRINRIELKRQIKNGKLKVDRVR